MQGKQERVMATGLRHAVGRLQCQKHLTDKLQTSSPLRIPHKGQWHLCVGWGIFQGQPPSNKKYVRVGCNGPNDSPGSVWRP
jgi:hypothetical protein